MSNISSVIQVTADLGDSLIDQFKSDKNVKTANLALSSFNTAIRASKTKLMYEKAVQNIQIRDKIEFLEG